MSANKIPISHAVAFVSQKYSSIKPRRTWLNLNIIQVESNRQAFCQLFKAYCKLYHKTITGQDDFDLQITELFRKKLDFIYSYLTEEQSNKGLLIFGGYGTGKTMTLWTLKQMIKLFNTKFEAIMLSSWQIVEKYQRMIEAKDYITLDNFKNTQLFIIDDLGTEANAEINVFGNRLKPIESLIEHRYRKGLWTWITTNYSLTQLTEIYSGYTIDRLRQMVYFIHFDWESYRR